LSQTGSAVQRVGSDLSFVDWSPCGQRLISTTQSGIFRIWETKTWDCTKWADLNGQCTNSCWSSDGSHLLFTVQNEPYIYATQFFNNKNDNTIDIGGSGVAMKCTNLSSFASDIEVENSDDNSDISIKQMAWNPTNARLAVIIEIDGKRKIALYHTQVKPQLQLVPCGYINGEIDEEALQIEFLHGFENGALLVVYWSSGHISLIPLYFNYQLISSRLDSGANIQNIGHTDEATSNIHHRTFNESAFNQDLDIPNDVSIFSTMD